MDRGFGCTPEQFSGIGDLVDRSSVDDPVDEIADAQGDLFSGWLAAGRNVEERVVVPGADTLGQLGEH